MTVKYLFYISQNYSFEILRPIQSAILAAGDQCIWFVEGAAINLDNFHKNEKRVLKVEDVMTYRPDVIFAPGNQIPDFMPGLKVQVFHGLEWKKKGHFRIRGFFDLYCTQGEITTTKFNQLAEEHGYFHVVETGWSKLDPLFLTQPFELETSLPVILFAPTFSPNLTSAVECFDEIHRLAKKQSYHWLVKFHPKMNKQWIELYRQIELDNFQIVEEDSCLPLLQRADVLLSDTSSIISEFLLLNKPAVTYKNSQPGDYLINVESTEQIESAIELAFSNPENLMSSIKTENLRLHPYEDGKSSQRILEASESLLKHMPALAKSKPINLIRNFKLRKKLNYWKWN